VSWGLHDSVEFEKRGRPAVTVITEAFKNAAIIRAKVLGMPEHPKVIVEHPMASKTEAEVLNMAERFVDLIASGLVLKP
jgi:hypothetical protein